MFSFRLVLSKLADQIGYRSVQANQGDPTAKLELKLSADSWGDILEAFPIFCLSFLCHFNILSVREETIAHTHLRGGGDENDFFL